jgi:hypothetical protein
VKKLFVTLVVLLVTLVVVDEALPPSGGRPISASTGLMAAFGISVKEDPPPPLLPDEQPANAGTGPARAAKATSTVMATRMGPVLLRQRCLKTRAVPHDPRGWRAVTRKPGPPLRTPPDESCSGVQSRGKIAA